MRRFLQALLIASCLTGCGAMRPTVPPDAVRCSLDSFAVSDIYSHVTFNLSARVLMQPTRKASFNVLALSAGGEFGAYGSGFLAGWGSVGEAGLPVPRDDIQIVTGVSTGALMATHAFLGDQDEFMVTQYSHLASSDVYRKRSYFELIKANSLFDTSRKDKLIRGLISSEVIDRVAAKTGRDLYLGFVDIDTGEFRRIDMVKLANGDRNGIYRSKEERDACYQAVVGASSAIPIAFEPKFVDGHMLVDGGARWFLFLTQAPSSAAVSGMTRRLFSFIHGNLAIACSGPEGIGNGVLPIAVRTVAIGSDQNVKNSVRLVEELSNEPLSTSDRSPTFKTYYAAAAKAAAACERTRQQCEQDQASDDLFCPRYEECLAAEGRKDGIAATKPSSGMGPDGEWLPFRALNLGSESTCAASRRGPVVNTNPADAPRRIFQ